VKPYEVAHLDELEAFRADDEGLTWRPVRRQFGIEAFGASAYTAVKAGDPVVPQHREVDNHEELYVVLRGGATFTLDEDEVDAPAGTFVVVRPGTLRSAVAAEDGTAVLAVGAKRGVVFEPSAWEEIAVAFGHLRAGRVDEGRTVLEAALAAHPEAWQGFFNAACFEALEGDSDRALAHLARAVELDPDEARKAASNDSDFDPLRADPRFVELISSR